MSEPPKIADELTSLHHVNVNDLEPFQGDLKELTKREYSKLKKSLNENGVIVPFFVWLEENKLLDGHQRQRVFVSENWLIDVPVVYISADSEQDAKKKLLVISSQYGKVTQEGWDDFTFDLDDSWIQDTVQFDALPFVFGDLEAGEPEQDSGDAEPQIDRAEELRKEWGVELGQMWRLPSRTPGQEHRLICGDCTDEAVVERVMGGEGFDVLSDAPYGINVVKDMMVGADFGIAKKGKYTEILSDNSTETAERFYNVCLKLKANRIILWGGNYFLGFLPPSSGWLIWDKRGDSGIRNTFADAEMAWCNFHTPVRVYTQLWNGMIREGERGERVHPTQKPVRVHEEIIENHIDSRFILDGFSGSGTTIIAAENLSRQCRAVEISPAYVAVALQRYKDAFGIEPELIA